MLFNEYAFYIRELGKGETLIEANWELDARLLFRGVSLGYRYGIQKQRKEIEEMAWRRIQIPLDGNGKFTFTFSRHFNPKCLTFVNLQLNQG